MTEKVENFLFSLLIALGGVMMLNARSKSLNSEYVSLYTGFGVTTEKILWI